LLNFYGFLPLETENSGEERTRRITTNGDESVLPR
jgi:hypothetical protein